jgi:hypothetical protein
MAVPRSSHAIALYRGRRRREVADRMARAQHHTSLDARPRLTEPAADGGSWRSRPC